MISFLAKIIVALNSNSRPAEMASAIAFGFWLALIPAGNLLWISLFIIAFFLKHNMGSFLFSLVIFRLITPLLDPFLDLLGGLILQIQFLQGFFTSLYNLPLLPYFQFNNTIVMGSFVLGLLLWVPLFMLFLNLVKLYRKTLAPKITESKLIKSLKNVPLFSKILKAARGMEI
jgi:uncharacterized protein (TIGR03546 family)